MSKVLKTIVNVILFCAIVVAAGLLIPPFAGVTTVMVDDVDMQTNLSQGSVAYAVEKDSSELKQGDKVLVSQDGGQYVYVVDSIDGSSVVLDDQLSTDGGTTQQELGSTVQKVMLVVPVIGYVSMALRNTEGLIIVGLVVVFVIILFILAEVWKKDDDEDEEEDEDDEEDESEEEQEEEPAVMSRRERKKARKAEKKKQKQEEKAAVAEAKARAKQERQEAKLAKKNKNADVEDTEETPEEIPAEAADLTQEIVLPEDLTQEAQDMGSTQEVVLPAEEHQPEEESTENEDPNKSLLEETASLFAADIASMMSENQTEETEPEAAEQEEETEEPEKVDQTQPVVLEEASEEEQEPEEKKLAMPVYTKEELLAKAEADGDQPEVIEDEVSGVTLVDYSDVL
ncbi:hypothetical protein [Blautia faecicola]|uniref:Signal peptidase I n=1 Tax=Blautia faecicola TaxID=2509240 RepID=A0A4Q1RJG6_9FIRM|nr:hypothetical protein [Blautia faecicola]RXS75914.1 hypothetical protein ETP43_12325 [Blautia faecicola]